jgi:hypothetical protein
VKKPSIVAMALATPLTTIHPERRADPLAHCHVCGGSERLHSLLLWREHDARDKPIPGTGGLVVVCDSKACEKVIEDHPRLYVQDRLGAPGHFPELCGDCRYRKGWDCTHPDLKANGGQGLSVQLGGGMHAIICRRGRGGGCSTPTRTALRCAGHERNVPANSAAPEERCPKGGCSGCDGLHHWSLADFIRAEDDPSHPAAKAGVPAWFNCKHCPAWSATGATKGTKS